MTAAPNIMVVQLPEVMDLNQAQPLAARLRGMRGKAVALDASRVERVGGLCLQVLLSARNSWASDNFPIAIVNPSQAFSDALALFGVVKFVT
jgi:chemotaxis protein CheX